tara:strand:- start:171 stop:596 length:426 start_codon:yes stop_codon:yes gene_type:complete
MSKNVEFNKQVFNKAQYERIIDTSFKQLGVKTIQEQLEQVPTVEEFFQLYDELFYSINELGPINSHEYLIKKSSEYIGFEEQNEIIEALQNEIAQLRTELLNIQKTSIENQTNINLDELSNNTSLNLSSLTNTRNSAGSEY